MQISGLILGQQRQVQLHERLRAALAAHAGVGLGGIEADLRRAGENHPVQVVAVGLG